jgi:hypothetical protein
MSRPASLREAPYQTSFGTSNEREFYKYLYQILLHLDRTRLRNQHLPNASRLIIRPASTGTYRRTI